jgi:uncharacterized delta-60 repeat protein
MRTTGKLLTLGGEMNILAHWKGTLAKAWGIAMIFCMLTATFAVAASGDLDTTFSKDGKILMDIRAGKDNYAWALAVQADGKIVTVGQVSVTSSKVDVAIIRYTKNGALDKTFNGTGKLILDLGNEYDLGVSVVIEPSSQKIVIGGQSCTGFAENCDLAVIRLNPNGSLDTTFNSTGIRIDDFGGGDNGSLGGLALQPDGKIVVGGYMFNGSSSNYDFAVHRYNTNGTLDTTFNKTGKKSVSIKAGKHDIVMGLALQSDGKIVAAGRTSDPGPTNSDFAVIRLKPNGTMDKTFKTTGKVITNLGGNDIPHDLAIQPDGKIVVVGRKQTTILKFALVRYNPDGTLDKTFAGTGKKVLDFSGIGVDNAARTVEIQPANGKIVVGGVSDGDFALGRFTKTGGLDKTFSTDGKLTIDFGGYDTARSLVIQQAGGKYVLAGSSNDGMNHWALARILP